MIKTVSENQDEIIASIMELTGIQQFDVDLTYGNGGFWKKFQIPKKCFDIDPQLPEVIQADSTNVPLKNNEVNSVMFDPPFVTYVRAGRTGNGNMVMAKRFGGYWKYEELEVHYKKTLIESHRILNKKGILVFKCQDIVHNHKLHPTHIFIMDWAKNLFRLKDFFILTAKHRMPIPPQKNVAPKVQKHARIYHSYFMVMEKI
jgi:hypothetical protein